MVEVVLIGSGNVAFQLHKALLKAPGVALNQVAARDTGKLADFDPRVPKAGLEEKLLPADMYLFAISDGAIGPVSRKLGLEDSLQVHTAGGLGLDAFGPVKRPGVLYPLQTFSRERKVDFQQVPVCIEAGKPSDLPLLRTVADCLSRTVVELGSAERHHLHLSAVFINNFTNHMVYLGEAICREQGLPEDLLRPLLRETCSKLEDLPPYDAQTGPARRGDRNTQTEHLSLLKDTVLREVYQKISESIQRTYD